MQLDDGTRSVIGRWAGFMTVVAVGAAGVWWATSAAPTAFPPAGAASPGGEAAQTAGIGAGGETLVADPLTTTTTVVVATTVPATTLPDAEPGAGADVADVESLDATGDEAEPAEGVDPEENAGFEPDTDDASDDAADDASDGTFEHTSDDVTYPAAPDGSPLPVRVVYDGDVVTLSGAVSSGDDRDRLALLAAANSTSSAPVVDNQLLVDENVPSNVGVRVTELQSERFPEGSAEILAEHSTQFMRVVEVLKALPNTTVTVIGHADQRGDDDANLALSEQRAQAVVNYIVYLGISPTRVASLAVGESDPLTLDDDEHALALNRRTEFVFYGVFAD